MATKNTVICLFEGYCIVQEEQNQMLANCTCTLIKSKNGKNILIDTMTPWDREKLLKGRPDYYNRFFIQILNFFKN